MAAPAARRAQPPRVIIPLLLVLGGLAAALALLLALSASSSRPSATAAAARASAITFRGAPYQRTTSLSAAAVRPPLAPSSSNASTAALPSRIRHAAPFVAVPASRHLLLAYPDDDKRGLHHHDGAGDAFASAPARRRHLLEVEYEPRDDDPHGGAGSGAAAAAGADADRRGVATRASGTFNTSVADPPQPTPSASSGISAPPSPEAPLPPPPPARCTFVTYIGGGAGTVELAHEGEERVFVVRERTGSSNNDLPAAPLVVSSDEESDLEDESDCCEDYGGGDFSNSMEKFCKVLGHAVTAIDKAPWLFRLWAFFRGG